MHFIVDARMINASGIGTYIRNLLREISATNNFRISCIINQDQKDIILALGISEYIIFKSKFFSPYEQIEYLTKLPSADLFWSPHFNAPVLSLRKKIPKRIVTIHDMFPYAYRDNFNFISFQYINFLMKRSVSLSDLIFTVSEFSKSEILKYLQVPESKICTVPLGVDPGFSLNQDYIKKDKKYILCVGNVKPHKNIKRAIEAFNKISEKISDYELVIVGKSDGFFSPEKGLESVLANNQRIRFTGFVTFNELREYYSNASLLLFPSLYEGFGLPVLEAMAFKLPIAASQHASIPEVGGDNIIYFNPESENEIANAILNILNGKVRCKISSYEENLEKYTWKKCAQKTIEYIKKLG